MNSNNKSVDSSKIIMSPSAVVVSEVNVGSGIILKEKNKLNNQFLWHKFTVFSCSDVPKEIVLKTIVNSVQPLDFTPVRYSVEGNHAHFFARNCGAAIEKLCNQNLIVLNPQNKDKPFKLAIILAFTHTKQLVVNVQDNISFVLNKRLNRVTKLLNLDNFCKDPDLKEYCTFTQPKILYFVMQLCRQLPINFHTLKLSNNEISILSPIGLLWGNKSLTCLDLRNNNIETMRELNSLKTMQILELHLDGNPVCELYDDFIYIQAIREVCPTIEKLDGVPLGENGFLAFRRNFLCNADGQDLVDRFLEHYFLLYDSGDRSSLEGLYHTNALFSLSCRYVSGQSTSASANLGQYNALQRNLKLLSDLAKSDEFLVRGGKNVLKTLCYLPPTEHDPYTFTVDLVYYNGQTAVLTVTGVFREVAQTLLDTEKVLGFSRTFVLVKTNNNEYNIVNEQLYVSNATTLQYQKAFKIPRIAKTNYLTIEKPKTEEEKHDIINTFKALTTLNLEWSKKCLEECRYELQKALQLFVQLFKVDKIPEEAFVLDVST